MEKETVLRAERLRRKLSQYDVERATGIAQVRLSYAERGYRTLTEKQRAKLADFYNINIDQLFPPKDFGGDQ